MADVRHDTALDSARAQRADVWRHLVGLEEALATPVPGRVGVWAATVHDALVDLAATFERHIGVTEGPHGLFSAVLDSSPRLDGTVARLKAEHEQITGTLASELRAIRGITDDGDVGPATEARERLTDVIRELLRHRQAGADLVYEAYAVDIGVGD